MEYELLGAAWVASSILSWFVLVDDWRRTMDLEKRDAMFFGFISLLGPMAFGAAIVVWCMGKLEDSESTVVWKRK